MIWSKALRGLFADDSLIYQLMHTLADHHILQNDLLKAFCLGWEMTFNICKYCIMQLSKHHHKSAGV